MEGNALGFGGKKVHCKGADNIAYRSMSFLRHEGQAPCARVLLR